MMLTADRCCALAVDLQERLMPAVRDGAATTENACRLLKGLRLLGVPVLLTEHYPKGLGSTLPEIVSASGDAPRFEKETFNALANPKIFDAIGGLDRKSVIVCGAEAHVCVLQTVLGLAQAGFSPVLVTDCIASRKESDLKTALHRADRAGALLITCESLLFELAASREHPRFKDLLALIK
jgi:nicotinamidase-related amidase